MHDTSFRILIFVLFALAALFFLLIAYRGLHSAEKQRYVGIVSCVLAVSFFVLGVLGQANDLTAWILAAANSLAIAIGFGIEVSSEQEPVCCNMCRFKSLK